MLTLSQDSVEMDAYQPSFADAVDIVATRAKAALPEAEGRIQRAVALVMDGRVHLSEDGKSATVDSGNTPGKVYSVNGSCTCKDAEFAPQGICKHKIAFGILKRATAIMLENATMEEVLEPPTPQNIPTQHIVTIHGKAFVLYAGLLQMAHERGLQSLKAEFTHVDADVALASATAVFTDGQTFTEAADSTKENVGAQVRPHWRRMALVRAKARCLRDALSVSLCSLEELE